jgi:glycosyl transferase family 87
VRSVSQDTSFSGVTSTAANPWRRFLLLAFLVASITEFAVRGPFRAAQAVGWNDFLSPYIQAKAWLLGEDPYSSQSLVALWPREIQHPAWVDAEANAGTLERKRGIPSPYPITTLVIVSPFAFLRWPTAFFWWSVSSVTAVLVAAFALLAACRCRLTDLRAQLFLAGVFALAPLHTGIATANPAMLVVGLIAGVVWAANAGNEKVAGVLLALALCLKPTVAGGILLYYLVRRRWELVAVTGTLAASIGVLGAGRLALAGVPWISSYLENTRRIFAVGSIDDFTQADRLRFNMIDAQVFFAGFLSGSTAKILSLITGAALLACWAVLGFRQRRQSDLLQISAISVLSLLAAYHRFYDAGLLILPLAWALMIAKKRSTAAWTMAALVPFFVPGQTVLIDLASRGCIPSAVTHAWWWNTVVLTHEVWDLMLLAVLLLYFMWRGEPEGASPA